MYYTKYEYIIKVADTKSISLAAKELYISQPALTKCINIVESELGVKLFNRKVIPLTLTYAGERFVKEARRILEIQSALDKEMEDICKMKKGRLAIGVSASRGEFWLPFMFPVFRKKYPGINVKLIEGTYNYLEEHIEKEDIDIALISAPTLSEDVEKIVLTEEKILLAVSEQNHLVKDLDVSDNSLDNLLYIEPSKLNGEDMISLLPGLGMSRYQQQIMQKHNIKPNVILETGNVDTAYYLACANMGVAFIPETCATCSFPEWLPVFCTVERPPVTRSSIVIYKKGRPLSTSAKAFIEVAKDVLYGDCPMFRNPTKEEYKQARKERHQNNTIASWLENV